MDDPKTIKRHYASSWVQLRRSIELIPKYLEPLILITVLPALLIQLGNLLNWSSTLGWGISIIGVAWTFISAPALICLELRAAQGQSVTTAALYRESFRYFWRVIGVALLTGLATFAGFLLLIVPGFILVRRFLLAPYYVIDKDMGVMEAIRQSTKDSKKASGAIWGSIGVYVVIFIVSIVIGAAFSFQQGIAAVLTTLAEISGVFLFALRYLDITGSKATKSNSVS